MESCILTEWKVNVGDQVAEGDVLAVIETDKASFDLESTAAGTVLALFWEADDDVPVLANVAAIGNEGEDVEEFRPAGQGSAPAPAAEAPRCHPCCRYCQCCTGCCCCRSGSRPQWWDCRQFRSEPTGPPSGS